MPSYGGNLHPHVPNSGELASGFRVSGQHQRHFAEQRVQRDGSGNSTSVTYSRSSSSHEFSFKTSRSQQGTPSFVCIYVGNIIGAHQISDCMNICSLAIVQRCFSAAAAGVMSNSPQQCRTRTDVFSTDMCRLFCTPTMHFCIWSANTLCALPCTG